MATFHDNKLWQDAYVAVLDVLEAVNGSESELTGRIKKYSFKVLVLIADSFSRRDRRERDNKLRDAIGTVYGLRSLLSVAWAQEVLDDEQFGKLDNTYDAIGKQITV